MTAWEVLKAEMTKGMIPGTAGQMLCIHHAAQIFILLLPYLKYRKREEDKFNADSDVTTTILNTRMLKEIGLLKE
jgi:hypothetical protein